VNAAKWIRWFFYPFPVFQLTFGYMSICNREIIQIQNQLSSLPGPLDINVAGLSIYFFFISTALYWSFIIMFELKVLEKIFCSRR
jgi:hypothetical protein